MSEIARQFEEIYYSCSDPASLHSFLYWVCYPNDLRGNAMGWVCKRIRNGRPIYWTVSCVPKYWTIDKAKAYVFSIRDNGLLCPGESWEAVDVKTTLDPDMEEACFAE